MEITRLLHGFGDGNQEAMNRVIPLVYAELKKLARAHLRREGKPARLETTALVHEAFLKLSASSQPAYENRAHFYGIVSRLMRQILVDTARAMATQKRDAAREVTVAEIPDRSSEPGRSVLELNDALQQLERSDPRKGKLIEMRYFGGLTAEESSIALSMPVNSVRRELRLAQACLRQLMAGESPVASEKTFA